MTAHNIFLHRFLPGALLFGFVLFGNSAAFSATSNTAKKTDGLDDVRSAYEKSRVRGAIVYKNYCVLCHGETGDGHARGAKLYGTEKLVIKQRSDEYYESIIRFGGEGAGRSQFMPIWQNELSDEQIHDVIDYLRVLANPISRGKAVFSANCILCHGIKGDGKGRASVLYNPKPSDLTRSDKNKDYKRMIITNGGASMGRSEVMPIWGEQLSTQEIDDVVEFLETIKR